MPACAHSLPRPSTLLWAGLAPMAVRAGGVAAGRLPTFDWAHFSPRGIVGRQTRLYPVWCKVTSSELSSPQGIPATCQVPVRCACGAPPPSHPCGTPWPGHNTHRSRQRRRALGRTWAIACSAAASALDAGPLAGHQAIHDVPLGHLGARRLKSIGPVARGGGGGLGNVAGKGRAVGLDVGVGATAAAWPPMPPPHPPATARTGWGCAGGPHGRRRPHGTCPPAAE